MKKVGFYVSATKFAMIVKLCLITTLTPQLRLSVVGIVLLNVRSLV